MKRQEGYEISDILHFLFKYGIVLELVSEWNNIFVKVHLREKLTVIKAQEQ